MNDSLSFVGIDVGQDKLDVFIDSTSQYFTVENTPPASAQSVSALRS